MLPELTLENLINDLQMTNRQHCLVILKAIKQLFRGNHDRRSCFSIGDRMDNMTEYGSIASHIASSNMSKWSLSLREEDNDYARKLILTLNTADWPVSRRTKWFVTQRFKKLGFDVQLEPLTHDSYIVVFRNQEFASRAHDERINYWFQWCQLKRKRLPRPTKKNLVPYRACSDLPIWSGKKTSVQEGVINKGDVVNVNKITHNRTRLADGRGWVSIRTDRGEVVFERLCK